jgi:hypothetical protein
MSKSPHLLRRMASRSGERISQRDAAALRQAALIIEAQAAEIVKISDALADARRQLIYAQSGYTVLVEQIRAAIEVTS